MSAGNKDAEIRYLYEQIINYRLEDRRNPFENVELLANGGEGAVFTFTYNNKIFVLKSPYPHTSNEGIVNEYNTVNLLSGQEGIPEIYQLFPLTPTIYATVGKFYQGETLEQKLRSDETFSTYNFMDILSKLFNILEKTHSLNPSGIIHSDIKPSNILLPFDGGVILADWGISRPSKDISTELNELDKNKIKSNRHLYSFLNNISEGFLSDEINGSLPYMSPECLIAIPFLNGKFRSISLLNRDNYAIGSIILSVLGPKRNNGANYHPFLSLGANPYDDKLLDYVSSASRTLSEGYNLHPTVESNNPYKKGILNLGLALCNPHFNHRLNLESALSKLNRIYQENIKDPDCIFEDIRINSLNQTYSTSQTNENPPLGIGRTRF